MITIKLMYFHRLLFLIFEGKNSIQKLILNFSLTSSDWKLGKELNRGLSENLNKIKKFD